MKVDLSKFTDVRKFSVAAMRCPCNVILKSGTWRVDGKSLMGIFSLNLSNPVDVELDTDDDAVIKTFSDEIDTLIVKD